MHKDFEEDAVDAAARVLETNWTGRYTVPATGLYPHQWSWDSAFVAIGTRHRTPGRARAELVTLLDAQWPDGRVPQIVYDVGRDDDYAPGAEFWRSATSGLVQPPVHAWAAWLVHCSDPAGSAREGFLARLYPRLARWHEYLHGPRAGAVGLPVTKHPWETGTDNSPLWDAALERVPPEARTAIRRPDLRHAGTGERPGSRDYRRYYRLAEAYRDAGCADDVPIGFAMVCPLFASVLAVSELALARMAGALADAGGGAPWGVNGSAGTGADAGAHETAAERVITAMDAHLWNDDLGLYVALDDTTGERVRRATVNGLVPLLLARSLAQGRTARLLATLAGPGFLGGGPFLPSTSREDPTFDPALYWRGPAWFNMSWLLLRAARALGRDDLAARLGEHFTVAAPEGFPEYADPDTGAGRGTRRFSWTAALTLDALLSNESEVLPVP
ncbi:MGH1-like glycoside hydrolase domain-containing protein [Promicromonospora panici]|uniref:MGH1-like glycoside hydrolase domain-containing protein n=1 Tax=Promicromonospora panici TaxID=2219658 RepID=UPI00101BF307|nr:trehalase family glycosidase [Promicromonospora panici]